MERVAAFAVLVAGLASSGCATYLNVRNQRQVYGGVRYNALSAADILSGGTRYLAVDESDPPSTGDRMAWAAWAVCDLPFSAIGDTLTLPATISAAINGSPRRSKPPADSDQP